MESLRLAFAHALTLVLEGDPELAGIVLLSLRVSLTAVALASLLGLPIGAARAVSRFPGRPAIVVVLNALMGLPPVVVGLLVYLMLSRAGPLGPLGILFTPTTMSVDHPLHNSQTYACPIEFVLTVQSLEDTKQLVCVLHIKASAVVTYIIDGFTFALRVSHLDDGPLFFGRKLERVGKQVDPYLTEQRRVSCDRREISNTKFNLFSFLIWDQFTED